MLKDIRKKQVLDLCKTCLQIYLIYLSEEEVKLIKTILDNINILDLQEITKELEPIVKKIWNIELESGNYVVVSWNKYDKEKRVHDILFATINKKDCIVPFCGLTSGILYEINYDSIVGALDKDGATLLEDKSKENEYTIGFVKDKVINSYNGATKLITPYQLVKENMNNDYKSKHNELILKADLVKAIGNIELDEYNSIGFKVNK